MTVHSVSKADINFFQSLPVPTSNIVEVWRKEGEKFVCIESLGEMPLLQFKKKKSIDIIWLQARTQVQGNEVQSNTLSVFRDGDAIYRVYRAINQALTYNQMLQLKQELRERPIPLVNGWKTRTVVERKLGKISPETQGIEAPLERIDFLQFSLRSFQKENFQYFHERYNYDEPSDQEEKKVGFKINRFSVQNENGVEEEMTLKIMSKSL